jgi:ADP-heptose:LPS heptosyltransferase
MAEPKHIIINRTDSIGDGVLTLPVAVRMKRAFNGSATAAILLKSANIAWKLTI